MDERKRLSKGTRRHIRDLKANIRRSFGYTPEADAKLKDIYEKFFSPHTQSRLREALVNNGQDSGVGVGRIIKETPGAETVVATKKKPETKKIPHVKKSQPRSRKPH